MVTSPVGEWGRQTSRDPCRQLVLIILRFLKLGPGVLALGPAKVSSVFYQNTEGVLFYYQL